jgi:hypothetical protein
MAHNNLATMMKEQTTAKQLTELMKDIVQTITAPEDTRKRLREKVEDVCGNQREREHSRRVEEFAFKVPTRSIEKWTEELRSNGIEPVKDVHFKTEHSVNYVNTAKKSWTVNEDAEAWKAVDAARDEFDRKEERRLDSLKEGEEKVKREMSRDDLAILFDETKRKARKKNREAKLVQPKWIIAERTQNNDAQYEDKELRFKERGEKSSKDDIRDTDWFQNVMNIAQLGERLGYTERHYKNVLGRFISWFNPELAIVTDPLHATDIARFLMRLHMPDTEEERIDKQLNRLTRKAGTSLRPVMAYLYEIVSAKYRDLPQNEKDPEIRKEMVRGLVRFTRGDLQVQIVQAIEYARKKKDKIDWRVLLEKSIEAELTQGMPQEDIKFVNEDKDNAATHKLYNVCMGVASSFEPRAVPETGESREPDRLKLHTVETKKGERTGNKQKSYSESNASGTSAVNRRDNSSYNRDRTPDRRDSRSHSRKYSNRRDTSREDETERYMREEELCEILQEELQECEEELCEKLQDLYNVYLYERSKEQYRERDRLLEEDTKESKMTTDTRETKKTGRKP